MDRRRPFLDETRVLRGSERDGRRPLDCCDTTGSRLRTVYRRVGHGGRVSRFTLQVPRQKPECLAREPAGAGR